MSFSMKPPVRLVAITLVVWLIAAVALSLSGRMLTLRPPMPQLMIVVLTVASLSASLLIPAYCMWADKASIRGLAAVHLTRFVGGHFLYLAGQGLLAPGFAIPAGWGDLGVSTLVLILLLTVRPDNAARRRAYFVWNILGLIDILFVVTTAARMGLADPASMRPLLYLPLSLLPTFLVPVIICSHILLFRRLRRNDIE